MRWRELDGVRWLEAELPGARAAFSTRLGGASTGSFESLNLGVLTGDDRGTVLANRMRLTAALGLDPDGVVIGRQVHGADVLAHDGPQDPSHWRGLGSDPPEVDGHATGLSGLAALVFVADCLPIALSGPSGVVMLHGGWRGLAGGIVERGARAIDAEAAAVGPGIGPCCFEVGTEVLDAFGGLGEGIAEGRQLDLREVAGRLLERAGVDRIETSELCTRCHPELFFSHRGEGPDTGRQGGIAWAEGDR
jgi:YfiH family protein